MEAPGDNDQDDVIEKFFNKKNKPDNEDMEEDNEEGIECDIDEKKMRG